MKNEYVLFNASIYMLDATSYARFNDLLVQAKQLHEICLEGEYYLKGFTQIAGDIWVSFYLYEPLMKNPIKTSNTTHDEFIEQLTDLQQFHSWSHLTKLDPFLSILATITICEQLVHDLKRDERTRKHAIEQKVAEKTIEFATNRLINEDQDRLKYEQSLNYRTQAALNMIKQADQNLEKSNSSAKQVFTRFVKRLPNFMQNKWNNLQINKDAIYTLCAIDGKKIEHVPLKEQFNVAKQLANHELLRDIAEMVGRFKKIAKKKMKTVAQSTTEYRELSIGNEISRTIPSELVNYMFPKTKVEFLKRYAESQLLIFNKKGKATRGKGPMIICMDESSSMNGMKVESKAFCLALLFIATRQKRDLAIVPFASTVGSPLFFSKGQSTTEELLQFNLSFLGGGTNYEHPLREALNILQMSKFNEADIIFVTDGSSYLSQKFVGEFCESKRIRKFECTSIILNKNSHSMNKDIIERFSDNVFVVKSLLEAEDVFSIT